MNKILDVTLSDLAPFESEKLHLNNSTILKDFEWNRKD